MLLLLCPNCESAMVFPSGLKGTTSACPNCQRSLTVPTRPPSEEEFDRLVLAVKKGENDLAPPLLLHPPTARARCAICSMLEPLGKLHRLATSKGESLVCTVCWNREQQGTKSDTNRG
jgi:hypothetical protein